VKDEEILTYLNSLVMTMGKLSRAGKKKSYFKIFEQIFEDPTISIYDISRKSGLSRNTVSKYLKEMYTKSIIVGPQIRMKPAEDYTEYVYLMNFRDPFQVFEGLKRFPHVLYHVMTFGDWNLMVVTDRPLDFSKLIGFETMAMQGVRGRSYTPKVTYITWDESFKKAYEEVERFTPARTEFKDRTLAPRLGWGKDEWKLFRAFKFNMRRKVTPMLRRIRVRYETYTKWSIDLENHSTIHVGFYPEGYQTYMTYCFLFYSDYESTVKSLFSSFPTTPFIVEIGNHLMTFTNMISSQITRQLFCTVYDMKKKGIIKGFKQAVAVFHCQH
jgi:DNA-binding Lrp family transcriptional regulator